jgi:Flp pilus assembly protein TadG
MSGSYLAFLPAFARDQRGSTAMVFALAMVPALAAVGLAIDYGRAHYAKDRLQNAVDAAALAGARLPATAKANREQAARGVFSSNLVATNLAAVSPTISASNAEVSVAASFTMPTAFMSVIGVNSVVVNAQTRARSQVQNGGVACLLALNPSTSDGLHLQGINKFSEQNCWAWVNSTSASAINAVGAATGTAQGFCSAGGVVGADHFAPAPFTQCDPLSDPFASMFAPLPGGCAANNLLVKNGTYTLNPGTYCGGLILKPQADVTFNPGLYIIKDGVFEVQGQANAAGRGVVFVFTGSSAAAAMSILPRQPPALAALAVSPGFSSSKIGSPQARAAQRSFRAAAASKWKASSTCRPGASKSAATATSIRRPSTGP